MNSNLDFQNLLQKDYKVFVDALSLMQKDSEHVFYNIICPNISQFNQKIIIPRTFYNEIKYHFKKKQREVSTNILNELEKFDILQKIYKNKSSEIQKLQKDFDKNFKEQSFLEQFKKILSSYDLCWITNNEKLKENITKLKNETQNSKNIKLFYIKNKRLNEYKFQFSLPQNPKKDDSPTGVSIVPKENDTILDTNGKSYTLLKEMGKGAEGSVYSIKNENDFVCKIYEKDKNTKFKKEKIELLIKHKDSILAQDVCLPQWIAFNSKKEFVGYVMPKAVGKPIKTLYFIPLKNLSWNRLHLSKIAVKVLENIYKLHQHNIILGDINPQNILIQDENNIFIIDTDSFQIEDYPCPVGVAQYTRPENDFSINYRDYLRKKEDDIFGVFTLAFQLMIPGQSPYAHKGGGSMTKNIKEPKNFPYGFDQEKSKNVPAGSWEKIWNELPETLKSLFGRFFKNREEIKLKNLINELNKYIVLLEKEDKTKEIVPSRK